MEIEKMIFWRNFLLKTFIVGAAIAVIYFITALLFFNSPLMIRVEEVFRVSENEMGRMTLRFFGITRFALVFFALVPCLALHWMIKQKKS